jgi:hypothetical protein
LNSFQWISNREYFKNLLGCYFSFAGTETIEIIVLYDSSRSNHLNHIQIKTRIKKLLGLNTDIELGDYNQFSERILEMISIERKTQTFGEFYFYRDFKEN